MRLRISDCGLRIEAMWRAQLQDRTNKAKLGRDEIFRERQRRVRRRSSSTPSALNKANPGGYADRKFRWGRKLYGTWLSEQTKPIPSREPMVCGAHPTEEAHRPCETKPTGTGGCACRGPAGAPHVAQPPPAGITAEGGGAPCVTTNEAGRAKLDTGREASGGAGPLSPSSL